MRANGVDERYCTGDASDWEKFEKWAGTVPYTMRNPLYHWTHLELKTAFGVTELLNPTTTRPIYDRCSEKLRKPEIDAIFNKVYGGRSLTSDESTKFKTAMLVELAVMDWESGWVQQFHYGAIRNNNSRMFGRLGADTGYDSIGDFTVGKKMARFFDMLDSRDKLAKTIIYNLNPRDNELVATMAGNFQDGRSGPGKIQFGSGWWFSDQKDGMEKQMNALSTLGLLSRFVGMLTDSRSFLSYPRHEYFRRTLCNLIGNDIENGLLPASETDFIGREIVEGICYRNAKNYFNF